MDTATSPTVRQIRLEQFRVAVLKRLDGLLDSNVDISQYAEVFGDDVLRATSNVWGRDRTVIHVETPATWWESVWLRWAPAWAQRRWPVRWAVTPIQIRVVFPDLKILTPHGQGYQELTVPVIEGVALRPDSWPAPLRTPRIARTEGPRLRINPAGVKASSVAE